ncbi:MAG: hypothetical protein WDN28_33720 [Chthoniobacter sp.]
MNISKLFLVGAVGLAGLLVTSTARADDHRRHNGDRHDYRGHYHYYGQRHYYYQQPGVYYGNSDYGYYNGGYYNGGGSGVTIAIGGHRSYRHHHHR